MRYRYLTCDVFTDTRFGGNPLAVLPEAEGLSDRQMQQIAREFNYSETTFVLPSSTHDRRVRIFTPAAEIPFAGHPNVGTAFVLATTGALGDLAGGGSVRFEERAGTVPVSIRPVEGSFWCELAAPQEVTVGEPVPEAAVAKALSLEAGDVVTATHRPVVASVGLPFVMVEVTGREALSRIRVDPAGMEQVAACGVTPDIHVYARSDDEVDIRARMFAPGDGVPEDPATGSANCALVGLLTSRRPEPAGRFRWRIAQGVEMGRPSRLEARSEKQDGRVVGTWIGGRSVLVSEGLIEAG